MRLAIGGIQCIMKSRFNRLLAFKGLTIMDDKGITVHYSLANLAALYGSFIILQMYKHSEFAACKNISTKRVFICPWQFYVPRETAS